MYLFIHETLLLEAKKTPRLPFLIPSHFIIFILLMPGAVVPGACAAAAAAAASIRGIGHEDVGTRHACGYSGQCYECQEGQSSYDYYY